MEVKLLTSRVSLRGFEAWGDIIEVDDDEGKRMIAKAQAEAVEVEKPKRKGARNGSSSQQQS